LKGDSGGHFQGLWHGDLQVELETDSRGDWRLDWQGYSQEDRRGDFRLD
jgi:hypothetical protein